MFKLKAAMLVASLTISASASAGLIQYGLQGVTYADGATLSGWFYQDDTTRAIAHYDFRFENFQGRTWFQPEYGFSEVIAAQVWSYQQAPTNFSVFIRTSYPFVINDFSFFKTDTPGQFGLAGSYRSSSPVSFPSDNYGPRHAVTSGMVTSRILSDAEVQAFREYCDAPMMCVVPFVPRPLPEPGSFALLALAAAGLYSVRRRRSSQPAGFSH